MTSASGSRLQTTLYGWILLLMQWPVCAASLGLLALETPPPPFAGGGLLLCLVGEVCFALSRRGYMVLLTFAALVLTSAGAVLALLPVTILVTAFWLGLFNLCLGGYLHFGGHERAGVAARIVGILALGLLALEGMFVVVATIRPLVRGWSTEGGLFMEDPQCTNALLPGTVKHSAREVFQATYHTDPDSTRHVPDRPASGPAWACSGCSFAFGWGLDDDATLPAQLQKRNTHARVFNLAVPGHGTPDAYLRLRQFLEREPDCARCIYFFVDDHLMRMGLDLADFAVDDPLVILKRPAFAVVDGVPKFVGKVRETEIARDFRTTLARRSRVASILFFRPGPSERKFHLASSLLLDIKRRCAARGASFLVVRLPTFHDPNTAVTRWLNETTSAGIDILDLTTTFRDFVAERDNNAEDFFFPQDGHGNPAYNALMADWVTDYIRSASKP